MSDDDDLIRSLATLTPVRPPDATAIAFEAGRRSARASIVRWRVATATTLAIAVATLWPRALSPDRPTLAMTAPLLPPINASSSPPAIAPLPPDNVIALRDAVLDHGLAGLPPLPRSTSPARPISVRELVGGDL